MQTMTLQAISLLIVLGCLRYVAGQLRCNVGVDISINGEKMTNTYGEQVCPDTSYQSCLTANVKMTINEDADSLVLVSSCATECEKEIDHGCLEVLRNIGSSDYEEQDVRYNVSSCNVECCSTDLCNRKPVPIKQDAGSLRCYRGERQSSTRYGLVVDSIVPTTCPVYQLSLGEEASCLRATMETTEKQIDDIGNIVVTQCQPRLVCEEITCESILQFLPEDERGKVTACDISCCRSDLCNGVSSVASQMLLTSLFMMFFVIFLL